MIVLIFDHFDARYTACHPGNSSLAQEARDNSSGYVFVRCCGRNLCLLRLTCLLYGSAAVVLISTLLL